MKAVCPNGCEDKTFVTVIHITEDAQVDEHGMIIDYLHRPDSELIRPPSPLNIWTCEECGAEAKVTDET